MNRPPADGVGRSGRGRVVGDLMPLLGHSPSIPLIANADKGPSVRVGSGAGGRHSRRLLEAEERTDVSHGTPARRTAFTVLSGAEKRRQMLAHNAMEHSVLGCARAVRVRRRGSRGGRARHPERNERDAPRHAASICAPARETSAQTSLNSRALPAIPRQNRRVTTAARCGGCSARTRTTRSARCSPRSPSCATSGSGDPCRGS